MNTHRFMRIVRSSVYIFKLDRFKMGMIVRRRNGIINIFMNNRGRRRGRGRSVIRSWVRRSVIRSRMRRSVIRSSMRSSVIRSSMRRNVIRSRMRLMMGRSGRRRNVMLIRRNRI
jgi:hypothetical protein